MRKNFDPADWLADTLLLLYDYFICFDLFWFDTFEQKILAQHRFQVVKPIKSIIAA